MVFDKNIIKDDPLTCLALCIYFEARGEPEESQYWVGHVVMNRVITKLFPNTIHSVIFQKFQFSWTIGKKTFVVNELLAWKNCLEIAKNVIHREKDITNNALYFLTTNLNPSWSKKLKVRKIIGGMKFLGN